ncbi:hypothetical protein J2S19_002978 [Metabacillus malikii]|uniref:Uncharacterized protein n=1 Tax=Metabacillus malikii TaxID=1504265 RepID=A0ABT9ZIG7_9BACI|nr:hypothetical protein [Metabacillus malikii]
MKTKREKEQAQNVLHDRDEDQKRKRAGAKCPSSKR